MTDYFTSGILAFIQGATEFLPISSSAHLIMFPVLFGWDDQGLAFDIAVHVGTLIASVAYFRSTWTAIASAWLQSAVGRGTSPQVRIGWHIVVASIPVAVVGFLAHELVENELRSTVVIGIATLVFALWLWYADQFKRGTRTIDSLRLSDAVLIGLGQAVAIIPGTSRSGITITIALMLGLTRKEAAKFTFLLAVPAIAMAGGWQFLNLVMSDASTDWMLFGYTTGLSAVIAYLCIHYFLKFIEYVGMLPFVLYRIAVAIVILALL